MKKSFMLMKSLIGAFLIVLIVVFLFSGIASASPQSVIWWAKGYGSDYASSIQQTLDGGYIVVGHLVSGDSAAWILKLDSDGHIQWQKRYGGTTEGRFHMANSVLQTSNGEYVIVGATETIASGYSELFVLNLDLNGNIQWQKLYGRVSGSIPDPFNNSNSIVQTADGGFVVASCTSVLGAGLNDVWVLKLDMNGDVQWQKTYGGTGWDVVQSIQQTADNGYIVAGSTWSFGAGGKDAWVFKLDNNGNVQWQKTYGDTGDDYAYSIQQTSDAGYILAGDTLSFGAGDYDVWVLKLDMNGDVQWQKTYGGTDIDKASSVQQTSDGGYIVGGETRSFGAGGVSSHDAWVLKLDGNGNVMWQKTYADGRARSIQQISNWAYIVAGYTHAFGAGYKEVFVLKFDMNGEIPNCSMIGTSNAAVNDSNATVNDTTMIVLDSNTTSQVNTYSLLDSNNTETEGCFPGILVSPNGGEVIPSGSIYTIQWSAIPEAVKFDIGYSLDDGAPGTWKLIASGLTGNSYNWTVPAPDGNKNTCRVGVRGYNASGGVVETDTSDNPFTIEVVKLTDPNGGEVIISPTIYQITWQTNSTIRPVQFVQIYGSPNEGQPGTWRLLTAIAGNPGYYNWTVPTVGTIKGKCRIGVVLLDSPSTKVGQDMSDNNFTIYTFP